MRRGHNRRVTTLRDQHGATVVIVALCLVAFVGMTSLVVDLGGVYFRRVALQNSADAAALAAANACGTNKGTTVAEAEATYFTDANSVGAVIVEGFPTYDPMCDAPSGTVTVEVTQQQPTLLRRDLQRGRGRDGVATATAIWGGAGVFQHVAPLMLADRLHDCDIPPEPNEEVTEQICTFFWDNSARTRATPTRPSRTRNGEPSTWTTGTWSRRPTATRRYRPISRNGCSPGSR